MSEYGDIRVAPTAPAHAAEPIRPAHHEAPSPGAVRRAHSNADRHDAAAATAGNMRAAYAQFVVDPHTHDVVVRIRDAATDEVLSELPNKDVQAVTRSLQAYSDFLARHRAIVGKNGS